MVFTVYTRKYADRRLCLHVYTKFKYNSIVAKETLL